MGRLLDALGRWRHSRGYGVHSPFGYELVTRAVRPVGCAWYGYSAIDGAMGHSFDLNVRSQARMLLRLTALLQPDSVFLPQGSHPAYHAALTAANSALRIVRLPKKASDCSMVCSKEDFIPLETLQSVIATPGRWIVLRDTPEGWGDALFDSLPEGLMFEGQRNIFIIHRPGMQKVRHTMSIG